MAPVTQPAIAWGKAVNGLQLGLRFASGQRAYEVGELVKLDLLVRNTSDEAITLVDYIPVTGWAPSVRTSENKLRPVAIPPFSIPVQIRRIALDPGDTLLVGAIPLRMGHGNEPSVLLTPGTYQVSETYRYGKLEGATWSGELTTGELQLVIIDSVSADHRTPDRALPGSSPQAPVPASHSQMHYSPVSRPPVRSPFMVT
ncbi:MAG: hypothetical protein NTU53_11620 [Planctomycetota bacterium]|nr:hypothetical protein [Planctomycetota bacterium]